MVTLVVIAIAATSGGGHSNTPQSQAGNNSNPSDSQTSGADTSAAKKIADGIKVQSTGYSYSTDKSQITYGFILDNSEKFTGTVSISFNGVNGSLKDALVFTEKDLAAGAGDIGSITLSGRYTQYSYKVTIDGHTYNYPGSQITNHAG